MTGLIRAGLLALATCVLGAAAPAGEGADAQGYRLRLAIVPGAGAIVQRLTIPAAALAAAQTGDLADLRVFDASGRAMPIARVTAPSTSLQRSEFAAMPILGSPDALKVNGVSLRVDAQGTARVARIDGTVEDAAGGTVLGELLDTRAVVGVADTLTLDADVPAAQPVTFTVEASRDLANWRPIGSKVVYHAPAVQGTPEPLTVSLDGAPLDHDYLKVSWHLQSRPLSAVVVRGGVLTRRSDRSIANLDLAATPPPLADGHTIDVAIPFAARIETIQVVLGGSDLIVPVRILGRNDREQPWELLGQGVATRDGASNQASAIALSSGPYRFLRVEADARGPAFTSAPSFNLGVASREILFLAAGSAPYTLAAGHAGASDAFLPAESLMTQAAGGRVGIARAPGEMSALRLSSPDDPGAGSRQAALWAVLLLATAVLAGMAWMVWKRQPAK